MNNRIKILRKHLKKTQEEFGSLCGKSRRAIAAYEQGTVVPDASFIQLLSLKFKVNITWLKSGKGEMFFNSPYEDELLSIFNKLEPEAQDFLLLIARELSKTQNKLITKLKA